MRKGKISFLFLLSTGLSSCGYSNYDDCMLGKMEGQLKSMQPIADEYCELKYPYEKPLFTSYLRDDLVDVDWTKNSNEVILSINKNNTKYKITELRVRATPINCDSLPTKPSKPDPVSQTIIHNKAEEKLGFDLYQIESQKIYDRISKTDYNKKKKLWDNTINQIKAELVKQNEDYEVKFSAYEKSDFDWTKTVKVKVKNNVGKTTFSSLLPETYKHSQSAKVQGPNCVTFVGLSGKRALK